MVSSLVPPQLATSIYKKFFSKSFYNNNIITFNQPAFCHDENNNRTVSEPGSANVTLFRTLIIYLLTYSFAYNMDHTVVTLAIRALQVNQYI